MTQFRPRIGQQQVLEYAGGKMGISAVPGSGKTHTLAELAGKLVAERLNEDQEVLIVTLVNSAVDNFRARINDAIRRRGLLPNFGYRVRTLHGLAHDIVRERPALVSLSDDFGIIDERQANQMREDVVDAWLRYHPEALDSYLAHDQENRADWIKRTQWPRLARSIAAEFIARAKDLQCTPEILHARLAQHPEAPGWELARLGVECYAEYQRSLAYRGSVDFADLIRLALEALRRDPDYAARLRQRWPYVLEDEAQDSSELQEQILRLLAGDQGNWVRVGDPNQAIYDTFTNANPRYLRNFLVEEGVTQVNLPESGRSQQSIIDLANFLVDWTLDQHPNPNVRDAFARLHICPTTPGDPQPNPPLDQDAIQLIERDFAPDRELQAVVDSLEKWLPEHPDSTAAVLVARNERGSHLADLLKQRRIPYVELLRSTADTREAAGALTILLHCLSDSTSPSKLAQAFRVWRRADREDPDAKALMETVVGHIKDCREVEAYLWPRADRDWLAGLGSDLSEPEVTLLESFRQMACRWHRAASLPIDQLVLTLANDLFDQPSRLALAHKLANLLRDVVTAHPDYRLPELSQELRTIAKNERRFLGLSADDTGFEPAKGTVTVATMHKAKGLEWDRVYLLSANNYTFPSGQANDRYISEPYHIRDHLNLVAEAHAQLEALHAMPHAVGHIVEGQASRRARDAYVSERLRLLYVGITRARRDLAITWNTGRHPSDRLQPAVPFIALQEYWREKHREDSA